MASNNEKERWDIINLRRKTRRLQLLEQKFKRQTGKFEEYNGFGSGLSLSNLEREREDL